MTEVCLVNAVAKRCVKCRSTIVIRPENRPVCANCKRKRRQWPCIRVTIDRRR